MESMSLDALTLTRIVVKSGTLTPCSIMDCSRKKNLKSLKSRFQWTTSLQINKLKHVQDVSPIVRGKSQKTSESSVQSVQEIWHSCTSFVGCVCSHGKHRVWMNVEMFIVLERIQENKYYEIVQKRWLTQSPIVLLFVSVQNVGLW